MKILEWNMNSQKIHCFSVMAVYFYTTNLVEMEKVLQPSYSYLWKVFSRCKVVSLEGFYPEIILVLV